MQLCSREGEQLFLGECERERLELRECERERLDEEVLEERLRERGHFFEEREGERRRQLELGEAGLR